MVDVDKGVFCDCGKRLKASSQMIYCRDCGTAVCQEHRVILNESGVLCLECAEKHSSKDFAKVRS